MPDDPEKRFFLELERVASSLTVADGRESVHDLRQMFDRLKKTEVVSIEIEPFALRTGPGKSDVR